MCPLGGPMLMYAIYIDCYFDIPTDSFELQL